MTRTERLSGRPQRVYRFVYGWEPVTEGLSLKGGSPDRFLLEPVTGAAIVYDEGWVLFDTGFNPETIRDPVRRAVHYANLDPYYCYIGCIPRGDPLLRQVEAAGLDWSALALGVISHLHCDHSGGLRLFVDGPPVALQSAEHEFANDGAGLEHAFFRTDYQLPGLTWRLVEGEVELAPGLRAIPTFGHTPGHMSLAVELPTRTVVLAGDAADLRINIERSIPCGSTTHPDLEPAAARAIERLHQLDTTPGIEVWPSHDPDFWGDGQSPPRWDR
ncbi:MAG: N-acyl homoserine lactonase family protein [Actinomycetota bacterium]